MKKFKRPFAKMYEYLIFIPIDFLWKLSYKGLRKFCCPNYYDNNRPEDEEEAYKRGLFAKIRRIRKRRKFLGLD